MKGEVVGSIPDGCMYNLPIIKMIVNLFFEITWNDIILSFYQMIFFLHSSMVIDW